VTSDWFGPPSGIVPFFHHAPGLTIHSHYLRVVSPVPRVHDEPEMDWADPPVHQRPRIAAAAAVITEEAEWLFRRRRRGVRWRVYDLANAVMIEINWHWTRGDEDGDALADYGCTRMVNLEAPAGVQLDGERPEWLAAQQLFKRHCRPS
jgi:hypothetical protein